MYISSWQMAAAMFISTQHPQCYDHIWPFVPRRSVAVFLPGNPVESADRKAVAGDRTWLPSAPSGNGTSGLWSAGALPSLVQCPCRSAAPKGKGFGRVVHTTMSWGLKKHHAYLHTCLTFVFQNCIQCTIDYSATHYIYIYYIIYIYLIYIYIIYIYICYIYIVSIY